MTTFYGLVKSPYLVIPAKAGIQNNLILLDPGLRRGDAIRGIPTFYEAIKFETVLNFEFIKEIAQMTDFDPKKHVPLPKDTKAFYCADCGAVALDQNNICNPAGMIKKVDWCGSKDLPPPKTCQNRVNNDRYSCQKCGKTAINAALLCEPEKMELT